MPAYETQSKEPFLCIGSGRMTISLNVNERACRPDYCWQHFVIVKGMNLMTDPTHGGGQR